MLTTQLPFLLIYIQSVSNLFDLLSLFEKFSGLKMRHRKEAISNLQISDDPVYALGVHFTYNNELVSLKKSLSVWSRRDSSIYDRINIVKTLALSKLVFISSVMETPKNFAAEVNKIVFDYIWKQKPAKIKKDNPYEEEIGWRSWHERFRTFR